MSQELEQIDDHVERAEDLLIEQFKGSTNLKAFIGAFAARVQEIEDMLIALWQDRWLDNATGVQLDGIGSIVGQGRLGLGDDDYRTRIKARIRINVSSGLDSDITGTMGLLLGDATPPIRIVEYYPASLVVYQDEYSEVDPTVLAEILSEVRAAAVDAQFVYMPADEDTVFTLASGDTSETSATIGLADDAQTSGGVLADVIEA